MLSRNSPVIKLWSQSWGQEGSLWWERFVKEVGLGPAVKERGNYGWWGWAWTGKSEIEGLEWGWRRELGSWSQRQGEAYRKERSVIRNEDDIGGRARITRDEERVLRRGWTKMRLCKYGGWVVVRTLLVSEKYYQILSSCLINGRNYNFHWTRHDVDGPAWDQVSAGRQLRRDTSDMWCFPGIPRRDTAAARGYPQPRSRSSASWRSRCCLPPAGRTHHAASDKTMSYKFQKRMKHPKDKERQTYRINIYQYTDRIHT